MDRQDWPNPESNGVQGRGVMKRDELRRLLLERPERPLPKPEDEQEPQEAFPEEMELEYERSVIRIPFYLKGSGEDKREIDVMVFDAYMRLIRQQPIRNGIGIRQFEFYIDSWELNNTYSESLNANITFTLSDVEQPKSICVARERDSDYPATIVYNAIYDVYFDKEKIIENQPGVAFATPVWQIPPRNVTVAFEKPFESDLFEFSAGTCEGMRSITREEFEEGVAAARRVRGQE